MSWYLPNGTSQDQIDRLIEAYEPDYSAELDDVYDEGENPPGEEPPILWDDDLR